MPQIPLDEQKEIIQRIKKLMLLMGLSQGAFSMKLGISPANMSKHLSGRLPITVGLINRICLDLGVSRLWLTTGEDVPFGKNEPRRQISVGMHRESGPGRGVPVYDLDVTAGFGPLEQQLTTDRISGYIDLPGVLNSANECMVRVSGDSMEPSIPNGSYIAIREVAADTIVWGKTYVVVMEEFRMVKTIRKHKNQKMVILHSQNADYDDIEIRRDEIIKLYIVDSVINYKTT